MPVQRGARRCLLCPFVRSAPNAVKRPIFSFPSNGSLQRLEWLQRLQINDLDVVVSHGGVCSAHFQSGVVSRDPKSIDYVPTQILPSQIAPESVHVEAEALVTTPPLPEHDYLLPEISPDVASYISKLHAQLYEAEKHLEAQGRLIADMDDQLKQQEQQLIRVDDMNCQFVPEQFKDNTVMFYRLTGLPCYESFEAVFEFLEPVVRAAPRWKGKKSGTHSNPNAPSPLSLKHQFFVFLLRLRQGISVPLLAHNLNVSERYIGDIMTSFEHLVSRHLHQLFTTMKVDDDVVLFDGIHKRVPHARLMIDCTELRIEQPSAHENGKMLYSNYKVHTTVKYLVVITVGGFVRYISEAWSGRTSDRHLVRAEEIPKLIRQQLHTKDGGIGVLADRGFDMQADFDEEGIELLVPGRKGKLSKLPVDLAVSAQYLSSFRVHVERKMAGIKKNAILQKTTRMAEARSCEAKFRCCAYLTNFANPMVEPTGTIRTYWDKVATA